MRKIRGITSSISSARGVDSQPWVQPGEGLGKFEDIGLRVPTVDAFAWRRDCQGRARRTARAPLRRDRTMLILGCPLCRRGTDKVSEREMP